MRKAAYIVLLAITAYGLWKTTAVDGQGPGGEAAVIARAAEALGGRDRILALKTLQIVGYGENAYMNGGGNITGSPDAPQKWQSVVDATRTFDLEHGRMRVQQRLKFNFVFANAGPQHGLVRVNEGLDGDVAFNIGAGGFAATSDNVARRVSDAIARERRKEMLANPITIIRAALDPSTKVSHVRTADTLHVVDITVKRGDQLTLAVDPTSNLPAWVSYVAPHVNLGDLTLRTSFVGYEPVGGLQLPMGYTTWSDFRNVIQSKFYVDRNIVNGAVEEMAAPPEVRKAPPPAPQQGFGPNPANLEATKVADHIWYIVGTTVFEFDDHLVIYEVNGGEARVQAVLEVANSLVPGKRVTRAIVSHHHFDHTAGLRAAVAEGLEIIARRGNEGIFRDMTTRPARLFPDALGRSPKPMRFTPVDDHLKLKDNSNEIDIYHVIANNHMADGVLIHVPRHHILVEADLTTENWDYQWWGGSYMDNVDHRKIKVETNLAVHAQKPIPIAEVLSAIEKQVNGARDLCTQSAAAKFYLPGCPVQYSRESSRD